MNKKRLLIGLALIVIVVAAAVIWPQRPAAARGTNTAVTQPAAPKLQTAAAVVLTEGQIVPNYSLDLAFQSGGEVIEILVAEGETVSTGDPLLKLEASTLELALSQAQARVVSAEAALRAAQNQMASAAAAVTTAETAVAIAQANLDLSKAGPLPEEIAAAEANLAAAEAAVNQASASRQAALDVVSESELAGAQADLASATAELLALQEQYDQILEACFETADGSEVCPLYGPVEEQARAQLEVAAARQAAAQEMVNFLNAGPTAAQRAVAGSGVTLALASRDAAQAQLNLLLEGSSAEQIEKAEVGVAQAELGVALAQVQVVQVEAAVSQAEAGLAAAQAAEAAAQAALDRMTLTAPIDGTVASLNLNLGELVAPGAPVVTLADETQWKVETTDLSELDVPKIAEGSNVTIRIDAVPEASLNGHVEKIAYVPGVLQGDVVYTVTIVLDDSSNLPLRWGMTAVAEFE